MVQRILILFTQMNQNVNVSGICFVLSFSFHFEKFENDQTYDVCVTQILQCIFLKKGTFFHKHSTITRTKKQVQYYHQIADLIGIKDIFKGSFQLFKKHLVGHVSLLLSNWDIFESKVCQCGIKCQGLILERDRKRNRFKERKERRLGEKEREKLGRRREGSEGGGEEGEKRNKQREKRARREKDDDGDNDEIQCNEGKQTPFSFTQFPKSLVPIFWALRRTRYMKNWTLPGE